MRKVIFEIAVSLDGFIEGPRGELDWLIFDEEGSSYANDFLSGFDTIFYGRVAYEKFGVHKEDPDQPKSEREFNNSVNNMRKYVFSPTLKQVEGNGIVINDNIETAVMKIRKEEGKNIWLCGGAGILTNSVNLNLIDKYILAVQPIVLGSGKPLFKNIGKRLPLKLVMTQSLNSGVVILHFEPEKQMNR